MHQRLPKTIRTITTGMLITALLLGGGALATGCSSSSDDDALAEFEGTWRVEFGTADTAKSTFSLACPDSKLLVNQVIWDKITLEPGPVSDLTETSGPDNCQFPFNVTGKVASVPATDPYTGKMVTCRTLVGTSSDAVGNINDFLLDVFPTHWDFNLLAPVKGQPPTAQLIGSAPSTLSQVDEASQTVVAADAKCTYDTKLNLTKIAK